MPVIVHPPETPFPPGHPFATPCILFVPRQHDVTPNPVAPSEPLQHASSPNLPTKNTDIKSVWKAVNRELAEWFRASGYTLTEIEPADTNEFIATFPQGRAPEPVRQPLVPVVPYDLEDIAFEILRQARYRRR